MDRLVTKRTPLRAGITKLETNIKAELAKPAENITLEKLNSLLQQLEDKIENLNEVQEKISDLVLDDRDKYSQEEAAADTYREKYFDLKTSLEGAISRILEKDASPASSYQSLHSEEGANKKKSYKLPKFEIKKYGGDIKEWLGFWSSFEKIHLDDKLEDEDKFQYLRQFMVPESRAAVLVESFPATAANYPLAIEQLKNRFGRSDLLIQVYVRELLSMVMENVNSSRSKGDLATLYDKLECHLRALETLGCAKDKFEYFLTPLVESCLPEEILRIWERKRSEIKGDPTGHLTKLMQFLDQEVNGQELFNLARQGFGCSKEVKGGAKRNTPSDKSSIPTATSLVSTEDGTGSNVSTSSKKRTENCHFCNRGHNTQDCYSAARKMTLEEKNKILFEKRCCLTCYKMGHNKRSCQSGVRCIVCDGRHYPNTCPVLEAQKTSKAKESKATGSTKKEGSASTSTMANQTHAKEVLLQTLLVKVEHPSRPDETIIARALIDTGSQKSYVSSALVKRLNLEAQREENIAHGLFGGTVTEVQKHLVYKIFLASTNGKYRCNLDVLEQGRICGEIPIYENYPVIPKRFLQSNLPEYPKEVSILFGADVIGQLYTDSASVLPIHPGLVAVETKFGWTVMGKIYAPAATMSCMSLLTVDTLPDLWKVDILGILDPVEVKAKAATEQETMRKFQESVTTLESGRYQVELPWRESHQQLSSNRELAWKRNQATRSKLEKEGKIELYSEVFDFWITEGIIEAVPPEELKNFGHYLPHRPVFKETSTTRVRPVFDASAHEKGQPSLNNCLEKGPNLIEQIPDVLDRFRAGPVAVVADIEKAFLQLQVAPEHRDFLRFFGPRNNEVYRHCRVVFGVSSSPFLLGAVLDYHLARAPEQLKATANKLKDSFYVDNCVTSLASREELEKFVSESKEIMSQACLNLRGWESNLTDDTDREVPVLGLLWNLNRDTLRCNLERLLLEENLPITKRQILSVAQRVFDPVGALSPVTLLPKRLLQELWDLKVGWDETLPEQYANKFRTWKAQLHLLQDIRIPRFAGHQNESTQLHVFVDASQEAYAACLFLRTETEDETVTVTLLRAKARVAPLKKSTIPRLELLACCIGARLAHNVKMALNQANMTTTYWSDSTTALSWIKIQGPWATFVFNRVKEIRSLSSSDEWRHVPGEINPADLPSRGCSPIKLIQSQWWEGPEWLLQPSSYWPKDITVNRTEETDKECRKSATTTSLGVTAIDWYLGYFSSYQRILHLVAWIQRFIRNAQLSKEQRKGGSLTLHDVEQAEVILFRSLQDSVSQKIGQLNPALLVQDKNGLWRLKTPIVARADNYEFLHPIILPGDHPLVRRLIEQYHRDNCHAGSQILLGILREKFWILKARKAIREVIRNCGKCLRHNSKPLTAAPAVLPADRVNDAAVFEITGVDLAGPLFLKDGQKAWMVLYTCAVYRAVHLEVTTSLSVEAFLRTLRRFIARRGRPRVIYSDNGTNFVGTENAFKALDWSIVQKQAELQRIVWKFNPPTASWWGGWWERLIGIVKVLLRRVLGRASLTFEELTTVLCDCEAVVNSRPLTYLGEDIAEAVPITPALFLRDLQGDGVADIDQVESTFLQRRIRYRNNLRQQLRQRFRSEYLGQLVDWADTKPGRQNVKIGEVVLIGDDTKKRIDWPLGKVVQTFPGRDGQIRRVRLRTQKGELVRPIQRIFPLEVPSGGDNAVFVPAPDDVTDQRSDLPELHSTPDEGSDHMVKEVFKQYLTKGGRLVRQPRRLDLLNQEIFVIELNPQ